MPSASALASDPPSLRRVVVGTLGHIDHGKTALVQALTGIDCDRWSEEKERGITIDIGFAHLRADDLQVGFIDVPGHERFLHNALAGLGGIRIGLLVVSASEGIMPQTREHLAICSLLAIPSILVALSKRDLVEPDLAELAELEIEELLDGSPYSGARVLRVSAVTGEGIDDLRDALLALASGHVIEEEHGGPVRFPIDRAFLLKGLGSVVTGTLASGAIVPGDKLDLVPGGGEVRVRNVQVHGENRARASAGERTSLQVGGAGLETLRRGLHLVSPGAFVASRALCVRFHHLPESPVEIGGPIEIRFHHYSTDTVGTLRPLRPDELPAGEEGLAEIRVREAVVASRGDRFVVRRPSPATTIGGGTVLDPRWRRPRREHLPAILDALSGETEDAIVEWFQRAGEKGLSLAELRPRLPLRTEALRETVAKLVASGRLLEAGHDTGEGGRWIAADVFERVVLRTSEALDRFFDRKRLAATMSKAELIGQVLRRLPSRTTDWYLAELEGRGVLEVLDDTVRPPGFEVRLSEAEKRAADKILEILETGGLSPPDPASLEEMLGPIGRASENAVEYLLGLGKLVRLPNGALLSAASVETLMAALLERADEPLTVQDFKGRFDLTRKWAIPLLEHLDSIGFTRRVGEARMIVRPKG